jgi:perosamine synthetase
MTDSYQWPWPITDDGIRQAMEQMLADGSWGRYHGPHCDALRDALAGYHSVPHVHLCSSGTSAIELALRAAKVSSGDEVILAAYDYKANFANVLTVDAQPVLVDTLPHRPILDPDQLESALSPNTKAIICSHLHGCLAAIDRIAAFASEHNLTLIEDACQVPGASLNGRRVGTIGDVGVLSFGGSKLLTAGRGGALITDNDQIAQRIRLYTQRGNDAYPLSEMQAGVLLPQLHQLDERNQRRRESVERLRNTLTETSPIEIVYDESIDAESAYYKVAFWARTTTSSARNAFAEQMRALGIPIDPAFLALHLTHAKSRFRAVGDLNNATLLHERLLTLHHPVLLAGRSEVVRVAELLAQDVE